jgi:hypothetical protein
LMTLGTMTSPSEEAEAWRSLSIARRRGMGMEVDGMLPESVLRFLAIQTVTGSSALLLPCLIRARDFVTRVRDQIVVTRYLILLSHADLETGTRGGRRLALTGKTCGGRSFDQTR